MGAEGGGISRGVAVLYGTRKRTWYMYVLHMNMPERLRDSANTGGQNLQIFQLLNVMVGSSRLTRLPESDPNARGRVRGIALLCVQMKNHHTSRWEQIAMQLNQVANQFRFCGAKLLCNF